MKKVEIERQAIVKAINEAPNKNITVAAKTLGASRRTLQTRMRDYGMPVGESGRPRHLLTKHHNVSSGTLDLSTLLIVGTSFVLGYYVFRYGTQQVVGGDKAACCTGLDVILRR